MSDFMVYLGTDYLFGLSANYIEQIKYDQVYRRTSSFYFQTSLEVFLINEVSSI